MVLSVRRIIIVLSALYLAVAMAAVGVEAMTARASAWKDARLLAGKVNAVLAERTLRTITATRAILNAAREHVANVGVEQLRNSNEEWQRLHDLAQGLPEAGSLWLLAPTGEILLNSLAPAPPPVSSAGREFLRVHVERDVEFYLGPVMRGRWTGTYSWPMSVGLRDADGLLLAVVVAVIDADSFTPLQHAADLGDDAMMELFRSDGALLLRQPMLEQIREGASITPPWADGRGDAEGGTRIMLSRFDRIERLFAFRRIPEYDVYAVVGLPTAQIEARWRSHAEILIYGLAGALIPMLVLSGIGLWIVRREEAVRSALAEANASLERRVEERTREAEAARQAAERANADKSRFLAAASHDLRQPMQSTVLLVDLLRARLAGTPEAGLVEQLHQATVWSGELLKTLMDLSALESGQFAVQREPVAVAPLLAALHDEWAVQARDKGLELRVHPVDAVVITDAFLLKRALSNLLANAIRYTDRGRVLIGARRTARGLRFAVYDTGAGIAADQLTSIFEDFHQLGASGRAGGEGLGLGLGIVQRAARLLGLEISVRSVPGRGSTFTLLVPDSPEPPTLIPGDHVADT
jgi:two-component system, sensor histidine kinase